MSDTLLRLKLFIPPRRPGHVSRTRLLDRLAATPPGHVTLVVAPSGAGKTTLLADWARHAKRYAGWLSLEPADDEPRRFLGCLNAALGIDADPVPAGDDAIRAAATRLLDTVRKRAEPLSLVLDDYHCIQSRVVHAIAQLILDHLPPNLHVVIASAAEPPLGFSRLRADTRLHELTAHDLRSVPVERRPLRPPSSRDNPAAEAAAAPQGKSFGALPAEAVQPFLLKTSILTRLNASLCDAVTGGTDGADVLAALAQTSPFLIPLDDAGVWYRWQDLYAAKLRDRLTADELPELHRRASGWYLANHLPEQALEHALAANDVERALDILRTHALPRALCGDTASPLRWFDMCHPALQRGIPSGCTTAAPSAGDPSTARRGMTPDLLLIRAVIAIADRQPAQAQSLLTRLSPASDRGALLAVRGILRRVMGHDEEGLVDLEQALELVTPDSVWYSMVSLHLGMRAIPRAEPAAVVKAMTDARSQHSTPAQVILAVLAQTATADAERWRGDTKRALRLGRDMFPWIDATGAIAPGRPLDAFPNAVLAEVYLAWNDLPRARKHADAAVEHARHGFSLGCIESSRALARVAEAERDWETAERAVAEWARAVRNAGGSQHALDNVEALRNRMLLRRGELQPAARWLESNRVVQRLMTWDVRRLAGIDCDAPLLLAVRVRMEQRAFDEALYIVSDVLLQAIRTGRVLTQVEALIVRALVKQEMGIPDEAVQTMERALKLASAPRFLRLFVDEGAAVLPLIERAARRVPDKGFVKSIFEAMAYQPAPQAPPPGSETLTGDQVALLRMLSSGITIAAAAEQLSVRSDTLQKRLKKIYTALQVRERGEALERARELKVI